jgi:hypothetical protein
MGTELPTVDDRLQRFKHLEIQINTACDCACFGCDRYSDVIHDTNMSVDQVWLFVQESIEQNWEWERIRLLGGEPTLHPHFMEIVHALIAYREEFPGVFLQVLTNGLGKIETYRQRLLDLNVDPHVEAKTVGETPIWFTNTRIAPIDRDPHITELPPCGIFGLRGCGIGLTRHGYFLDGAGASIARVAGYDIGVMELRQVTWDAMEAQAKVVCRVCGHWNPPGTTPEQLAPRKVTSTGEITGPFWDEKIAAYQLSRPPMRLYGAGRI